MAKPDKKHRHKAKREAKRRAARRASSVSPVKRLADAPGDAECWLCDGFDTNGQAEIFAYKAAGPLAGIACFLVDRGVVGLKDAFVHLHVDRAQFDDMVRSSNDAGLPMRRAPLDEVRRLVAGGLRWAHDNGMRLPRDWAKPASLIGGVGDWHAADVSRFLLEFAGHPDDLRQRLIGQPLESFLRREDIDFVFNEDAPYMDQETGDYVNGTDDDYGGDDDEEGPGLSDLPPEALDAFLDQFTPVAAALAEDTLRYLAAAADAAAAPVPELVEAWRSVLLAKIMSSYSMADAPEDVVADFAEELLDELGQRIEDDRFPDYDRAVSAVLRHLETDPAMMARAIAACGPLEGPPAKG